SGKIKNEADGQQGIARIGPGTDPPGRQNFNDQAGFLLIPDTAAVGSFYFKSINAGCDFSEISLPVAFEGRPLLVKPLQLISIFRNFGSGITQRCKINAESGLIIFQHDLIRVTDGFFEW